MSEPIRIGIELYATDAFRDVEQRLENVVRLMERLKTPVAAATDLFKKEEGAVTGLGEATKEVSDRITEATRISQENIRTVENYLASVMGAEEEAKKLTEIEAGLAKQYGITKEEMHDLSLGLAKYIQTTGASKEEVMKLLPALIEEQKTLADTIPYLKETEDKLNAAANAARAFMVGQDALVRTTRRLGIEIFWLGLGSMFLVMSLARARRTTLAVERAQLSWRRAQEDLNEAMEEHQRILAEYGSSSREAIESSRRLEDAQMGLKFAEDSARMAIEQQIYGWMMLALGIAPTVLRAVFSITGYIYDQAVAMTMLKTGLDRVTASALVTANAETKQLIVTYLLGQGYSEAAAKSMVESGAYAMKIPIINMMTTSYLKAALAVGLLTGGITLAIAAVTYFITQATIEDQMRRMKESIDETTSSIGPASYIGSVLEATRATKEFAKEVENMPIKEHSPIELQTKHGWTKLPEIMETPKIELGEVSPRQVTVINYGPWYVREEADIHKITREQHRKLLRGIYVRTGRYT